MWQGRGVLVRAVLQLAIAVSWMLTLPFRILRRLSPVAAGSYLLVEIDGKVVDFARPPRLWEMRRPRPVSLHGIAKLTEVLADDDRIRGVVFIVKSFHGGMATATSLRQAFAGIRALGREVVVHLPQGGATKEAYLAAGADKVFLGPQALMAVVGFLLRPRYVRRALDKAGVVPEVYAMGKYKSAGEQIARDGMSDAQREQLGTLLDALYADVIGAIASGRRVSEEKARAIVDGAPYLGEEAVAAGMVDGVAYEDELPAKLGNLRGFKNGDTPRIVDADHYLPARAALKMRMVLPVEFIGVIPVHGAIASAAPLGFGSMAIDDRIIAAIRTARKSSRCLGVVLHVDSPGGSALASDRIHHELEQLALEKPLIACMANVAASGGYYVAAPAHAIVAQPTTVTGSIGVVAARLVLEPLLARLGISTEVLKRGAHAGLLAPTAPFDDEERRSLERELEAIYRAFVGVVARGRKKDRADIERVAQGRVWTGADALREGLVDRLGSFEDALGLVRAKVGTGGGRLAPKLVRGPRRSIPLDPPDVRREAMGAVAMLASAAGLDVTPLALGFRERVLAWSADAAAIVSG